MLQSTGAGVNNRRRTALKDSIRAESIECSKEWTLDRNILEGELVRKLEEIIRNGIVTDELAAIMTFD